MKRRQQGAGGLFIAVLLLLVIGGILATLSFLQSRGQGDRSGQDTERFEKIKGAMVQFVAANGRLPCPANGTANPETGAEDRTALSATCNSPTGSVPWSSIGIRRDDAIDAYGWKISYRVYTGTAGSLTQDGGTSMVECDTVELISRGTTAVTGSSGGLCRSTLDTLPAEFLAAAKGLSITWHGSAVTRVAYVLVSHGPSGRGAFTSGAPATMTTAPTAGGSEASNLSAAGPFIAKERMTSGLSPDDVNYFDDLLAYQTIADVVRLAGRDARDWPEAALSTTRLDRAALEAAIGATISGTNTNLNQTTLYIGGARVTGLAAGVASNLAYFSESGGVDGIGVAAGTSGRLNSSSSDAVRLEFNQTATKLGLTLNNFGIATASGRTFVERAQLTFYDASGALVDTRNIDACRTELSSGRLASFSVSPAAAFSRVEIAPKAVTVTGVTRNTSLILSEFVACNSSTCLTGLYDAVNNSCP